MGNSAEMTDLIQRAIDGDERAADDLFQLFRERLKKMVSLRMDRRLLGRVDASDIIQEATLEAVRRLPVYAESPPMDFYLWLRCLAGQKLIDACRHHLGTQKRDAGMEVSLYRRGMPEATSNALAAQLMGRHTSPSMAAVRAETQIKVQDALNDLEPIDREVLILRHFEHLTNSETAQALGLKKSTASKRYVVALKRLREQLKDIPGFKDRW